MIDPSTAGALVATVLSALAALMLVAAVLLARALSGARRGLVSGETRLLDERHLLVARFEEVRSHLADLQAVNERGLWTLAHLDQRLDAARSKLVARREDLDRQRGRILATQTDVARWKSGARMLIRALELGRTFRV